MKLALVVLGLCAVVFAELTKEEYCDMCYKKKGQHTMCKYDGVSDQCTPGGESGVSDEEKKQIVRVHNELRNKVANGEEKQGNPGPQPSASNMKKMSWDDDLALVAQRWTDQCIYDHDTCRDDPNYPSSQVGQNMAMDHLCTFGPPMWTDRIANDWYQGEVIQFNPKLVKKYEFDYPTAHYTALVNANTTKVGCGLRVFDGDDGWCNRMYVCNYGPSGNWADEEVYIEGPPRASCPDSPKDPDFPALCG